ncbi:MAG: enoyl-CoA hydratase [Betaproteobacteria bacterium]|nr:enoyl-CoA hydratase [Betaproteobacteria bacterium]
MCEIARSRPGYAQHVKKLLVTASLVARGVARVTIDNAAKLNSMSSEVARELATAMHAISGAPGLRVVVLTGAGNRAFVGGANLDELGALNPASAREFITRLHHCCAAMRDCPVPVIARVNGWCIGAGLELAASCDFRIASGNAMFGMPEVRLGIPSVIEAALLPRLIGAGRARWLVLTGENITAEEAQRWGFLERVVPAVDLDREVDAAVEAILKNSDAATRAQKRLQRTYEDLPLDDAIRGSIDEFARSYESGEPQRLVAEFAARRLRARE